MSGAAEAPCAAAARFRQAMRQFAAAVTVLTVSREGSRNGLTATAVMSLTAEPPRLAVAVNRSASACAALLAEGRFGVNVLRQDQAAIAARFAGADGAKGEARFAGAEWFDGGQGVPLLAGGAASLACEIESVHEVGSHALLVAAVREVQVTASERPLLYLDGGWASLVKVAEPEIAAYLATVNKSVETVEHALEAAGTARQKLERFVHAFTELNIRQSEVTRTFFHREEYVDPDRLAAINGGKNRFDARLRELIRLGMRDGSFHVEDEGLTALAITGMMSWMHRWYVPGGRLTPGEVAARLARLIGDMVAAGEAPPAVSPAQALSS